MRLYGIFMAAMAVIFLGLFGLVEALELPLLTHPEPWLTQSRGLAAVVGFGLLTSDVLLPVPASLVMVANGALFGILWGTVLSTVGGLASAALGFALGRWGGPWLDRFMSIEERRRANRFLGRWGGTAVLVSRPIPVLSESVSILAGTTPMSWSRFLWASLLGGLPASVLYAVTGATAMRMDSFVLIFGLVLAVAGLFWCVGLVLPWESAELEPEVEPSRRGAS